VKWKKGEKEGNESMDEGGKEEGGFSTVGQKGEPRKTRRAVRNKPKLQTSSAWTQTSLRKSIKGIGGERRGRGGFLFG